MKNEKRKVAIIGALNVDIGGRADEVFAPGDSIPGQVSSTLGGVGWNIARNCALLGAASAFCSVLGLDEHTNSILAQAEELKVSLEYCRWEDQPNNRYLYITDHLGDMVAAVNDMRLCARVDSGFVAELLPKLQDFGAVVCDANLPAETLRLLADGVNAPLVADGVSAVKCVRLRDNLHRLQMLKVNLMEARTLTGETEPRACARALLKKGVKQVVVSMGAEGALCGEEERLFWVPPEAGDIVDTTGAGDSVTAALAVGVSIGMDFEESVRLGMKAAAITMASPRAVAPELAELRWT